MKNYLSITGLLLIFVFSASAQVLEGKLSDDKNNALPFANIFIKGSTIGTSSNEEGIYRLEIPALGKHQIVFQYIGYQQQIIEVDFTEANTQTLDVRLAVESLNLGEIVISGEDPAYEMIRQTQAKRKFHLEEEFNAYSCDTYSKTLMRGNGAAIQISIFGIEPEVAEGDSGIFYLSEALSKFHFEQPRRVKEEVKASLVSGKSNDYTLNRSALANFYSNIPFQVNDLKIVSPIARNAFEHYDYEFLGDFKEGDLTINKIKLIPKDIYKPAFSGVIYLIEESWRLHSLDVFLTTPTVTSFKKLSLRQTFVPVGEGVWLPSVVQLFFEVGNSLSGYYLLNASNYQLNPEFTDGFFDQDLLEVKENANKKNAFYWDLVRPIPLTEEEKKDYQDKFMNYQETKSDTTGQTEALIMNGQTVSGDTDVLDWLITGAKYKNEFTGVEWKASSLIGAFLNYNTVEGLFFNFSVNYEKTWQNHRRLKVIPTVRYGFKNETPQAKLRLEYASKPNKFAQWHLEGGRFVEAFSRNEAIAEGLNTAYSLMEGHNYLKLYQKTYGRLGYQRELFKGVQVGATAEFAYREGMQNNTDYSWVRTQKLRFTPNFPPENFELNETALTQSNEALFLEAELRYAPGERYTVSPKEKKVIANRLPILRLSYRRGLLDTDFEKIDARIYDRLPMGLFGVSQLQIGAGTFLNNEEMTFIDYHHFLGNRTALSHSNLAHFDLLDYYQFSTSESYLEAHFQHNFDGFFFRGIPLIKKWKWQNLLVANYLYTEAGGHYVEVGWGIEGILRILRVEYVVSFRDGEYQDAGFRLGVSIGN